MGTVGKFGSTGRAENIKNWKNCRARDGAGVS
jgi:hypothetical protein